MAAVRPQQPRDGGVPHQADLIGGGLAAGGPISGEVEFPGFHAVFCLSPRAVEALVDPPGCAAGEVGDDEACVGALRPDLDAGDDALDPAPAAGPVPELLVATQLVEAGHGGAP